MALYRHYDPQQTKLIAVSYGRQLLPSTFEHALSYLIDSEIDLDRVVARFKSDDAGARARAGPGRLYSVSHSDKWTLCGIRLPWASAAAG